MKRFCFYTNKHAADFHNINMVVIIAIYAFFGNFFANFIFTFRFTLVRLIQRISPPRETFSLRIALFYPFTSDNCPFALHLIEFWRVCKGATEINVKNRAVLIKLFFFSITLNVCRCYCPNPVYILRPWKELSFLNRLDQGFVYR